MVVVDVHHEGGAEAVNLIKEKGVSNFFAADVSKSADVQAKVQAAVDTFVGLDCAINNAVTDLECCY